MKDAFALLARRSAVFLLALLAFFAADPLPAQQAAPSSAAPAPPFDSAVSLDAALDRPWTRQDYLNAYIKDYDQPDWPAFAQKERARKQWGRNEIWELQPDVMLYRLTGDHKYSLAVQAALLSIAENPPPDLTFSLSAICYLFEGVRADLPPADRAKVEAALGAFAESALKGEKGTAMNRGMLNAFGLAYAARVLPDDPRHAAWDEAQHRMFADDFERIQDTNEDSTNYHFVFGEALIRYVKLVDKDPAEFYARPYVKALFERWLGLATPFGGFPVFGKSGWHYPELAEVYEAAAAGSHDGRYRWLARRILNYARANGQKMPNTPLLDYLDDSIVPAAPSGASFFNDARMGQKVADKLVVRTGRGPADTYVAYDLLNEGGHGFQDATALVTLVDAYAPLLVNPFDFRALGEENKNIVLFRRVSEGFPFSGIGPTNDPQWRRAIRPLRFQHTAVGGANIDFKNLTSLSFRINPAAAGQVLVDDMRLLGPKGDKVIDDFETPGPLPKGASLSNDAIQGQHSLALNVQARIPLPWPGSVDASDYDALQVWYRFVPPLPSAIDLQLQIDGPGATGHWGFFDTYRNTRLRFLQDNPDFHAASLAIVAKPYFGGTLRQFRDTLVLPGRLVWIRDTVQPLEDQEIQFGPLWHVDQVLGRGDDWIQTTQGAFVGAARGHDAAWQYPRRNLLIRVVPRQPGSTTALQKNPLDNIVGHRALILGNWKGSAKSGATYAFDSFLLPNGASPDEAAALAQSVRVAAAAPEWTIVQMGDDYLVANPLGRPLSAAGIETDCHYLHFRVEKGTVAGARGIQGTYAKFNGADLHCASEAPDFPRN